MRASKCSAHAASEGGVRPEGQARARAVGAVTTGNGPLHLDETELVSCVSCGLCLPHCPTYRVTGLEIASPRGRIAAMRLVEMEGAPIDAAFETAMNECVQCRGCEAACPSSVQFGHLMEDTRAALHERGEEHSAARGVRSSGSRTGSCFRSTRCCSRSHGSRSSGSGCGCSRRDSASRRSLRVRSRHRSTLPAAEPRRPGASPAV